MVIIGLTGPSGAGKSTLCERFESLGIPCIDTDAIYRDLVSHSTPCLEAIKKRFGNSVIDENGTLNRSALAKLVFTGEKSKKNLEALNHITHKYVWDEVNKLLTKYMDKNKVAAVIDAPVLFSSKIFIGACDLIISVLCDKDTRVERIVARDNISLEQALARVNAQPDDEFFITNSEHYIYNRGTKDNLYKELDSILRQEGIRVK